MLKLNPYLNFKDNCEEAFHFYKAVFGGEILFMGRYKDVPEAARQWHPAANDEQIMHATLRINADTVLMGSDSVATYDEKSNGTYTNDFFLYISTENLDEAYRIFDELSVGGTITLPMTQTFWSAHYGIVIDQFGIKWKITADTDQK